MSIGQIGTIGRLGLAPIKGVPPLAVVSASVRAGVATVTGSTGANAAISWRLRDVCISGGETISAEFWNGYAYVATSGDAEQGCGAALPIAVAFIRNPAMTAAVPDADQTAAEIATATWTNAAAGVADYLFKADGSAASAAEFTAAGGSASGATITLPSKWRARCDSLPFVTAPGDVFLIQTEIVGASLTYPQGVTAVAAIGDRRGTGTIGRYANKNWSSGAGTFSGLAFGPVAVWTQSRSGKKTLTVAGDSIAWGNSHSALGSTTITGTAAAGIIGPVALAAYQAGIPFHRTAISGDKATTWYARGTQAHRLGLMRYSAAVLTTMGHNDRGLFWSGAAGTGFLATYRWYWATLRAAMLPGARVIATELLPQASSTDSWATTANMTSVVGPGTTQYDSYHPWLAAGAFVPASGDPDGYVPINEYVYTWAAGFGGLDIDAGHIKPPANGLAAPAALWADTTHPKGPVIEGIAPLIAAGLPARLGW